MWRVSIEAGEAYSGPHLIPGGNDGRAGYSTGGEFCKIFIISPLLLLIIPHFSI